MIPTKQQCLDAARFYLGDDQTSGGEVFTNTLLEQPFAMSVRELWRALGGLAIPRVQREAYYDLPAYTEILVPSTASITDLSTVEIVEERGSLTSVSITGATIGSGFVTITAAGHPFVTGDEAVIFGVGGMGGVNGRWGVTLVSSSTFKLNGAVGTGTYTSSTGTATKSTDQFSPLTAVDRIEAFGTGGSTLGLYAFFDNAFHFPITNTARELRITYISSAATISSTSDTTGIDDSLDFIALRTAALAASSRGARDRAAELNSMALGPAMQADGTGGVLRELVCLAVRAMQATPIRRPPFRDRGPANIIDFL